MTQSTEKTAQQSPRVASPYPALQALLPRLKVLGHNTESRPLFDTPDEVEEHLDFVDVDATFYVIPVWAINHTDLTNSEVVNWSYTRWLH